MDSLRTNLRNRLQIDIWCPGPGSQNFFKESMMKCVRISKTVMDRREGGSEGGRELKAMKFGPGSHAVSVLNFGKHYRAFASKVL